MHFDAVLRDISSAIRHNHDRLSYGVAALDIDGDGRNEFVVTGYGHPNLVLDWQDGEVVDIAAPTIADPSRRAIGIAAGDVDEDGDEELYILNTDTYMGMKRYGDRLFDRIDEGGDEWRDLYELPVNVEHDNLHAGRSVAMIDIEGSGRYSVVVATYGGPMRVVGVDSGTRVRDTAPELGIELVTGGRSLVVVPEIYEGSALLCGNENDANACFVRERGRFVERAVALGLADATTHARGIALVDLDGDGMLDIAATAWHGPNRLFVRSTPGDPASPFLDRASLDWQQPGAIRTLIAADFDNDGDVELFVNVIDGPNRLFRVQRGRIQRLDPGDALLPDGLGTGAAVADIDGDGVLELLVAHGESAMQPLSLFRDTRASENGWLRVLPLTASGAPARGAIVRLDAGGRSHVRVIDGGSGYLCQMEPVAHFGLGKATGAELVTIRWPDGHTRQIERPEINQEIEVLR